MGETASCLSGNTATTISHGELSAAANGVKAVSLRG